MPITCIPDSLSLAARRVKSLSDDAMQKPSTVPEYSISTVSYTHLDVYKRQLLEQCGHHKNFVISSGCDIPPNTDLDTISSFFDTVESHYYMQHLWDMVG